MEWVNIIIQGVLIGGLYAMFAAGLALIFGVMRLVNIAHGDLIVLAAYVALMTTDTLGVNPLLALVIVVPVMALIGYVLQRGFSTARWATTCCRRCWSRSGSRSSSRTRCSKLFTADSRRLKAGAIEVASFQVAEGVWIGVLPLLQFVVAVAVIAGLQLLFYRTAIGRAFRATSDDQSVAQLMGLDNRHVFGLAMALSLAVIAVAGVFLAMRTNFDPAIGPARLIFGFEAVIIGGLGSMWGTLAGGIVLGVAQAIGAQINPGWQLLAGHLAFPASSRYGPRACSRRCRDERALPRRACHAVEPDRHRAARRRASSLLAAAPFWGGRDDLRLLAEIYAYVALASLWNLLAGYAGLVSVGQQAYVGLGGYVLFASTILGGVHPLAAVPLAGIVGAVVALPVAGLMFRLRGHYFAIGTWVVAEVFRLLASQISALGGGSGISLPAGIVTAMASSRQMREFLIYWVALALVVIVLGAIVCCCARATAWRSRRSATTNWRRARTASTSGAPSSWSTSSPRSAPP